MALVFIGILLFVGIRMSGKGQSPWFKYQALGKSIAVVLILLGSVSYTHLTLQTKDLV